MNFLFKNKINKFISFKNQQKGFLVVEILVAASIITLTILSATVVAQKSIYVSRQALNATQAAYLLEEGAEAVRVHRDNAWSNISSMTVGTNYYPVFSGGAWTFPTSASTIGIFTRKVVLSNVNRDNTTKDIVTSGGTVDTGTKLVTVTISWNEGINVITKTLPFYITNIF
jgi:Tfp pilus assembly protein PilV